jgi:hypothetical protein
MIVSRKFERFGLGPLEGVATNDRAKTTTVTHGLDLIIDAVLH